MLGAAGVAVAHLGVELSPSGVRVFLMGTSTVQPRPQVRTPPVTLGAKAVPNLLQ